MNLGTALLLLSAMGAVPGNPPVTVDVMQHEANIVYKTNAERARFGLPPLSIDSSLMSSARRHAAWMTNTQTLRHTTANVAENIAQGQPNSGQVVRDWMNSPGHRANMLNPSYRRIGVAAYKAPNGQIFWCQQFLR